VLDPIDSSTDPAAAAGTPASLATPRVGVLVVAYTSLYVWLNRTLLRDAAEQVLADWDCRLSLTTMPYEREVLCSEAPVEVLEAMFLMPSARQRRRFPARTSR